MMMASRKLNGYDEYDEVGLDSGALAVVTWQKFS